MILHVVVFTFKPGVTDAQCEAFGSALDAIPAQIPELVSLEHGPDARIRPGNADYLLIARFADEAGWRAYQAHPAHKAFVADHVTALCADRVAMQVSA